MRCSSVLALGCAIVFAAACGGSADDTVASTESETLVDAVTGEEVPAPSEFSIDLDPGPSSPTVVPEAPTDPPAGVDDEPTDAPPDAESPAELPTGPREPAPDPDDEHPLEQVVIDTVVTDPEAAPVLDEAASLACANAEFAMDALIESSPDRAERFATAADWASESAYEPIRGFADRLAEAPTGADANELVIAVLETCAAAGYEL